MCVQCLSNSHRCTFALKAHLQICSHFLPSDETPEYLVGDGMKKEVMVEGDDGWQMVGDAKI